uniref:MICOS complex subunit MIC60 n=1 Tax=Globodera rostochiensis TaxID=31243 RepID=A0A914HDD6_GLORO
MSSILRRTRLSKICYYLLGSAIVGGGAYGAYASVVYYQAEEQRVMKAVEEQRKLDESLSKMALELETRRIRDTTKAEFDARILEERKMWEREMDMQLKRAANAHAEHLERVIKTQKQLHDVENQQLNEVTKEQRVEAVEGQRKDESLSKMALEPEMGQMRNNTEADFDARILEERKMWEREMDMQLRRAAIAHAEHLERMIKTQKQLHDVENQQLNEEAVRIERNKFAKQIGGAVTKLSAIEESLNSRAAMDLENKKAKIYWTICQSLMDTLVNGGCTTTTTAGKGTKTLYKTSLKEVALLKKLTENDAFAQHICKHFPQAAIDQGVPTEQGLKQRFDRVYKLARWTAQIGEEGGGLLKYIASWLQSLVTFELPTPSFAEDRINVERYEPYELLSQIRHFVEQRDLANAVRLANLMRGEPARVLRDWLNDAKYHLEVRFLIELLFAHSQAAGIMTTY